MLNKLLKLKHWQVFLLIFALPFILQIVSMAFLFTIISTGSSGTLESTIFSIFGINILISLISQVFLLIWYWAIATKLHPKIPINLRPNIKRFKFVAAVVFIWFVIFMSLMFFMLSSFSSANPENVIFEYFSLVFLIQLLMMVAVLYLLYYLGKTITLAEHKTEMRNEYFLNMILIWFYPIGVWVIQPKLNKIMQESFDTDGNI